MDARARERAGFDEAPGCTKLLTSAHFCIHLARWRFLAKIKRKTISVILSPEEYRRFNSYCALSGYKKSTLVARLIRDRLDAEKFMMQSELPLVRRS
jgi:hypothetical protein